MKAIRVENLSKAYQLGEIGTGTISRDLERWFAKIRGKEDPFLTIGEANDRTTKGTSDVVWSLKDLNFEIEEGDAVGIIGRNGAGKSTLLKLLSRVTSPTTGNIKVKGRIASLLEVGTGFHPELTGRENIYLNGAILGMRKKEIARQFDEIVDFSGVERYVDTPVKRYSSGMYVRLAFAVAAYLQSEILIVDEVLAVGDAEFQKKCLGKMGEVSKGEGRTVLFVSHNMAAVQNLCNNGIILRNGTIYKQGAISEVLTSYYGLMSNAEEQGENLEKHNNTHISISPFEITNYFQSRGMIRFDSPIEINIKGRSHERIKDVSFAIALSTLENTQILTTRLNDNGRTIVLDGDFDIKVTIHHNLRSGNYILGLGIDTQIDVIYYNPNVSRVEILDIGENEYKMKNYGIINVKSCWQVS